MVKCYPYFREDIEADLMALGVQDKIVYCENSSEIEINDEAEVTTYSGASKLVIPYYDVVCKLPITTHRMWEEDDNGEWTDTDESWEVEDFCCIEEDNYEKAVEAGVEKAFARCEFYGKIENIPVYIMERAECFPSRDKSKVDIKTEEAWRNDDLDDTWELYIWNFFVNYYGLDFCLKLSEFMKENDINDITSDNCGIINGRPVLIDYSGYWED